MSARGEKFRFKTLSGGPNCRLQSFQLRASSGVSPFLQNVGQVKTATPSTAAAALLARTNRVFYLHSVACMHACMAELLAHSSVCTSNSSSLLWASTHPCRRKLRSRRQWREVQTRFLNLTRRGFSRERAAAATRTPNSSSRASSSTASAEAGVFLCAFESASELGVNPLSSCRRRRRRSQRSLPPRRSATAQDLPAGRPPIEVRVSLGWRWECNLHKSRSLRQRKMPRVYARRRRGLSFSAPEPRHSARKERPALMQGPLMFVHLKFRPDRTLAETTD